FGPVVVAAERRSVVGAGSSASGPAGEVVVLAPGDGDVAAGPGAVGAAELDGEGGRSGEAAVRAAKVGDHGVGPDDDSSDVAEQGVGDDLGGVDVVPVEGGGPEPDSPGGTRRW